MSYLERARRELRELERSQRRRELRREVPAGCIDFSSNDYLGLRRDPRVLRALHTGTVAGSGGSRLLGGAHREHAQLEDELAAWTGRERALVFSSGYLAAIGAVVTLARCVDAAYSDALVHACMIDALRLTHLPRTIFAHRTLPERGMHGGAAMIVTESVFGMDGSQTSPAALVAFLRENDVLIVDEAHALGINGAAGAGLAAGFADDRIIVVGTLSKALGSAGGFVAGPADAIALLATAARTFVFDTAPPPSVVAAARAGLAIVRGTDGDELRVRLSRNARAVRGGLRACGLDVEASDAPIVPLIVGAEADALALAAELERRGLFAPAVRPPTVAPGTSRLRLTVRADHTNADIDALITALERTAARVARC